jgi:hypothetical protein
MTQRLILAELYNDQLKRIPMGKSYAFVLSLEPEVVGLREKFIITAGCQQSNYTTDLLLQQ